MDKAMELPRKNTGSFLVFFRQQCLWVSAGCDVPFLFPSIFSFFLPLPSLRRGKREAFPVSDLWFGYKEEELLEAAHGDSHRFKKSSVPALSIPVCSQGQSQIPHEGKPAADGSSGEAGTAWALARGPVREAAGQERGRWWSLRYSVLILRR